MADEKKPMILEAGLDVTSIVNTLINVALPALITLLTGLLRNNPTALEQALLSIIQSGVSTYEAQVGKPIDPTLLKPISPVT